MKMYLGFAAMIFCPEVFAYEQPTDGKASYVETEFGQQLKITGTPASKLFDLIEDSVANPFETLKDGYGISCLRKKAEENVVCSIDLDSSGVIDISQIPDDADSTVTADPKSFGCQSPIGGSNSYSLYYHANSGYLAIGGYRFSLDYRPVFADPQFTAIRIPNPTRCRISVKNFECEFRDQLVHGHTNTSSYVGDQTVNKLSISWNADILKLDIEAADGERVAKDVECVPVLY